MHEQTACMSRLRTSDVVIAGGGIIGLSLGLELLQRGLSVVVLERDQAMQSASWAAGGMLAARDPENSPALLPLSLHSLALYPAYLDRVRTLSDQPVPIRTRRTLQQVRPSYSAGADVTFDDARKWVPGLSETDGKFVWLEEDSFDPRDLCRALPMAFLAEKGILLEKTPVLGVECSSSAVVVETTREQIHAATFVNCRGAWAGDMHFGGIPVEPVKGQMVTVALAAERLRCVLRTPKFYAIPRGDGRVAIGATIEQAGFDANVHEQYIAAILHTAAEFIPEVEHASRLESWTGFRPGTPDDLPILGAADASNCWHATGHYRNGILLAPATARVMAQLIFGETPDLPLKVFSPARFPLKTALDACSSVSYSAR